MRRAGTIALGYGRTMNPIGILGDGQLALMLTQAARDRGVAVLALSTSPDSPMARLCPAETVLTTSLRDDAALLAFARRASVMTLESEFWAAERLEWLERESGVPIVPSPPHFAWFEGKLAQRRFFASLDLPGPRWCEVHGQLDDAVHEVLGTLGLPVVVKADRGGYDGLGVRVAATEQALRAALAEMGLSRGDAVLVEEKVLIEAELAQGILLTGQGTSVLLPLVETVQRDGVCNLVLPPDRLPAEVVAHAARAMRLLEGSGLRGLFNVELFWTRDGRVLVNEGAPRPHNSQHVTLDASPISQFGLLIDLLAGRPLPESVPLGRVCMVNLLGRRHTDSPALLLPPLPPGVVAHPMSYGKALCRPGRKMGHVNLVATDDAAGRALDLRALGERVWDEYTL